MVNGKAIAMSLAIALAAGSASAQSTPNAPRTVEISYTGNLPFFLGFGFVRKKGWNLGGACVQVSVRVTDSAAAVGEFCGTHQFVETGNTPTALKRRLVLSEPGNQQQVDSLLSLRGGMRFSTRGGNHVTTFAQGLAGIETGYRQGGFADNSGFSLAGGGGVDIGLTNWLALEPARAMFQTTRISGTSVNGFRFGTGWVARIGETGQEADASSPQP